MRLVANRAPEMLPVLATGSGKSYLQAWQQSCRCSDDHRHRVARLLARGSPPTVPCARVAACCLAERTRFRARHGRHPDPPFLSVEVASNHVFRQYARQLHDLGRLDRFIIDECHLIHTSAHYRPKKRQLCELRQFPVPFIYITATLLPRLEPSFFQEHHIRSASIVRGCSKRRNIRYSVQFLDPTPDGSCLVSACDRIRTRWMRGQMDTWEQARVMVFVRTQALAEEVASHPACSCYHSGIGVLQEKEDCLEVWICRKSGSPFHASTKAAGPGVDYAHVRWVLHIGAPYGLMDYRQESGRARRDGAEAGASIFLPRGVLVSGPAFDHPDPADATAMEEYLYRGKCRQLQLARELDRAADWGTCNAAAQDVLYYVCEGEASMPSALPPPLPVHPVPNADVDQAGVIRQRR